MKMIIVKKNSAVYCYEVRNHNITKDYVTVEEKYGKHRFKTSNVLDLFTVGDNDSVDMKATDKYWDVYINGTYIFHIDR